MNSFNCVSFKSYSVIFNASISDVDMQGKIALGALFLLKLKGVNHKRYHIQLILTFTLT